MGFHRHKIRRRLGAADGVLFLLALAAVAAMLAGPLAEPGTDWQRTIGDVTHVYTYQNASTADGRPYRLRVSYRYSAQGRDLAGAWDGEWPLAHSANALPPAEVHRVQPGYRVSVFYDPAQPDRSTLHTPGNIAPAWWLRLSIALSAAVVWYAYAVYPRWKAIS